MHLDGSEFTITKQGPLLRFTVEGPTGGRHVTASADELLRLFRNLTAEIERLSREEG